MRLMFEPRSVMISVSCGGEHDDVALLALDAPQHLRHLVRVDVLDAHQPGRAALARAACPLRR